MNILFVGDTSGYHSGCRAVVEVIKSQLSDHNIISLPPMHNYPKIAWDTVDWLLCNGEGTMHNNRPAATGTLQLIHLAQSHNIKTALINSVWQNMDKKWRDVIHKLEYFSVRENLSAEHAHVGHGRNPDVFPDLSYYAPIVIEPNNKREVVGQFFDMERPGWAHTTINIFKQEWNQIINILADAPYLYTGRHHELYASCVTKTPFIPHHANSHKLQGIFYSSNIDLPIVNQKFTRDECNEYVYAHESKYKAVFDWMDSFTMPKINTILAQS